MKSRIKVNCPLSVRRKCKCLWEMPPPMCHHLRRRRRRHQRCCRQCQCQSHTLAAAGLHCVLTQLHERQLCVCVCVIYEVNVLSLSFGAVSAARLISCLCECRKMAKFTAKECARISRRHISAHHLIIKSDISPLICLYFLIQFHSPTGKGAGQGRAGQNHFRFVD